MREQSSTESKQSEVLWEGADVVGGAGDSGGSGDAAEAEDGRALYVGREGKPVDEAGVDGGAGDSGDGGEEDRGDVLRGYAGVVKSAADGLLAEVDGSGDPGIVCLLEGV